MKPLQTHGKSKWIPPKEPFVIYEPKDEELWGRYCRKGHYETLDLFDVRDWDNELVGYTSWDPVETMDNLRGPLYLKVTKPLRSFHPGATFEPVPIEEIRIEVGKLIVTGEDYLCWVINPKDAPALILSKWIETIGPDNIHEFARRMEMKYYRNKDRW